MSKLPSRMNSRDAGTPNMRTDISKNQPAIAARRERVLMDRRSRRKKSMEGDYANPVPNPAFRIQVEDGAGDAAENAKNRVAGIGCLKQPMLIYLTKRRVRRGRGGGCGGKCKKSSCRNRLLKATDVNLFNKTQSPQRMVKGAETKSGGPRHHGSVVFDDRSIDIVRRSFG